MLKNLIMPGISFAAGFAGCAFLLSAPDVETSSEFKVGDCVRELGLRYIEEVVTQSDNYLEIKILSNNQIYVIHKSNLDKFIKVDCPTE